LIDPVERDEGVMQVIVEALINMAGTMMAESNRQTAEEDETNDEPTIVRTCCRPTGRFVGDTTDSEKIGRTRRKALVFQTPSPAESETGEYVEADTEGRLVKVAWAKIEESRTTGEAVSEPIRTESEGGSAVPLMLSVKGRPEKTKEGDTCDME